MKERPILFSGAMVQAILAGRKTQTRRVVQLHRLKEGTRAFRRETVEAATSGPDKEVIASYIRNGVVCPHGVPGDRLWVKHEHWKKPVSDLCPLRIWDPFSEVTRAKDHGGAYEDRRESFESFAAGVDVKKCPSIHMPRWASRITLEVVSVRVERVESISEADCRAEGCSGGNGSIPNYPFSATPHEHYRHVWESINGKGSWAANPWVWVVEFRRITKENGQ